MRSADNPPKPSPGALEIARAINYTDDGTFSAAARVIDNGTRELVEALEEIYKRTDGSNLRTDIYIRNRAESALRKWRGQ